MWLVGQVIDVQRGFEGEGERRMERPGFTTIYLKAGRAVTAVVCYDIYLPAGIEDQYVRVEAHLRTVHIPHPPLTRFEEVYDLENWPSAIQMLNRRSVQALRLDDD